MLLGIPIKYLSPVKRERKIEAYYYTYAANSWHIVTIQGILTDAEVHEVVRRRSLEMNVEGIEYTLIKVEVF